MSSTGTAADSNVIISSSGSNTTKYKKAIMVEKKREDNKILSKILGMDQVLRVPARIYKGLTIKLGHYSERIENNNLNSFLRSNDKE